MTLALHVDLSPFGPSLGLILHQPKRVIANEKAIIRPGIMPARNSLPIDVSVRRP